MLHIPPSSEGRAPHSLISSIRKALLPAVEFPISTKFKAQHTPPVHREDFHKVWKRRECYLLYLLTLFVLLFDCTILSVYSVAFFFFCRLKRVQDGITRFLVSRLHRHSVNTEIKAGSRIDEHHTSLKIQFSLVINSPKIQSTEPEVSL